MGKRKSRGAKIDALKASQNKERERERDEIRLGRFSPHAPRSAQIPTKTVRVGCDFEEQADVDNEWFGEFRPTDPGPGGGADPKDRRKAEASPYNRVWGRVDITVERFGRKVAWQRAPRKWAAERATNGPWPFTLRPEWEALGKALPRHCDPERDRADHLAGLEKYERSLDQEHGAPRRIKSPRFPKLPGPFRNAAAYARGVRWMERETTLAEHYERRIQRYVATWYKPSRALEEKRFKKLKRSRVEIKLFPKERDRVDRAAARAELEPLVAAYLAAGGRIAQCPAETTTAMLNKRKPGRPPVGERAMRTKEEKAERKRHLRREKQKRRDKKRRQREKLRLITATAPQSPGKTNGRTVARVCHVNPKGMGGGNGAKSPRP